MEYRRLGESGLLVSEVGLGTNNFGQRLDQERTRHVIDRALDLGITFIDTADTYGGGDSERFIGRALGTRRHQVVLATKFGAGSGEKAHQQGGSRRWIIECVEASLRRLDTDYIDLYQMHRPDPGTPILETLQALDDLVRQGKVRYIGHSNFGAWQIVDAQWTARTEHLTHPISAQHHYNLLNRGVERDVLPACRSLGLGLIPYFPLASGFLTGKYRPGVTPEGTRLAGSPRAASILSDDNFQQLERLHRFGAERGHTILELAMGWLLSRPEVSSVIAGATSPEQVDQNVQCSQWRLDPADLEAV